MEPSTNRMCQFCGHEMTGSVCDFCGMPRLVFPEVIPPSLQKMEEEMKNIAKRKLETDKSVQESLDRLEATAKDNEAAKSELETMRQRADALEKEVNDLQKEYGEALRQLGNKEKELQTVIHLQPIEEGNAEKETLQLRAEATEKENESLKQENRKLQERFNDKEKDLQEALERKYAEAALAEISEVQIKFQTVETENKKLKEENIKLSQRFEENVFKLQKALEQQNAEVTKFKLQLEKLSKDYEAASRQILMEREHHRSEIAIMEQELRKAGDNSGKTPSAYLIVKEGSAESVLPIFEGKPNFFGTPRAKESNPSLEMVKIPVVTLQKALFKVTSQGPGQFLIENIGTVPIIFNGAPLSSPRRLTNLSQIIIEGTSCRIMMSIPMN